MSKSRIYCNSCGSTTAHDLVSRHVEDRLDDFWGYSQKFEAEILRCCGCQLLSFRMVTHPYEFQDKKDEPVEVFFPERAYQHRQKRSFFALPRNVRALYEETVAAHDNELGLLSTVGLRALIEAIVGDKVERGGYGKSLKSKIEALSSLFQPGTISILQDFRVMGNKAIHDQIAPPQLDIHRALNVVEGIMEYFYGIDESVQSYRWFKEYEAREKEKAKTETQQQHHSTALTETGEST